MPSKEEFDEAVSVMADFIQHQAISRIHIQASFGSKKQEPAYRYVRLSEETEAFDKFLMACETVYRLGRDVSIAPKITIEPGLVTLAEKYVTQSQKLGHGILHYNNGVVR